MRLAIVFITSTAILLAATACGSDKKKNTATGGMCKGVYADKTLADLTSGAASTGACTSDTDLAAVCANDVNGTTGTCAVTCNAQGGDDATKLQCTLDCVKGALDPDPSDPCLNCYIASVACALDHCLTVCAANSAGDACTACRVQYGCAGTFYNNCSGLPVPTGLNLGGASAGGAGNGGSAGSSSGGVPGGGASNGGSGGAAGAP